jgi:hypothetical protein
VPSLFRRYVFSIFVGCPPDRKFPGRVRHQSRSSRDERRTSLE